METFIKGANRNQYTNESQPDRPPTPNTDPLTQLPNRRSFFRTASILLEQAQHEATPLARLVIDADGRNSAVRQAVGDEMPVLRR